MAANGIMTTDWDLASSLDEVFGHREISPGVFNTVRAPIDSFALQVKTAIDEIDGEVSVLSFGADPTGVLDSSAARDAAQAAVGSWGKIIVPAGNYRFDTPPSGNALWNVRHGVTLTGAFPTLPGVTVSTPSGRDQWSGALTGAVSGEYYHNSEIFTSDSLTNTGNTYCRMFKLTGRDSSSKGGRFVVGALAQMDSAGNSAQTAGNAFYCGLFGQAIANYDHAATGHAYLPSVFAVNSNVVATALAAGWGNVICHEFDVTTKLGADYTSRTAAAIVLAGDGPKASIRDAAISFYATSGLENGGVGITGWDYLFSIDKASGGSPIATDGTIFGCPTGSTITIANGIDLKTRFSISGYAWKSPGCSIDGDGDLLAKGVSSKSDFFLVKESASANYHFSRWTTDGSGQPALQCLSDALAQLNWCYFTRVGGTPAAAVFEVPVYVPASATLAGINIAPGVTPSSLANGAFWFETATAFARLNGVTNQFAFLGAAQTWTALQTFNGGVSVNGGTLTSSAPVVFAQTWNNAGVAFCSLSIDITDTASLAASYPIRARVGGVDMFSVRKDGLTSVVGILASSYVTSPNVYGGSAAGSALNLISTSSGAPSGDTVNVYTNGLNKRWNWINAGHFKPNGGNTFDIGDSTNTVRALYVADGVYNGANKIIGARKTGWGVPTGTLDRTALATYAGQTISNPPTQAEVQAIDEHLKKVSRVIGAMINDVHAGGSGSPTHMLFAS